VRELLPDLGEDVLESYEEDHVADLLCSELARSDPDSNRFHAKTMVLIESVTATWTRSSRTGSPRCVTASGVRSWGSSERGQAAYRMVAVCRSHSPTGQLSSAPVVALPGIRERQEGGEGMTHASYGSAEQLRKQLAAQLSDLAAAMITIRAEPLHPDRVVRFAAQAVAGSEDASLTIIRGGQRPQTLAGTSELPYRVDAIQYDTGQGPCLEALTEHDIARADDLDTDQQWPRFAARAVTDTGVRSMFGVRLLLDGTQRGALNFTPVSPACSLISTSPSARSSLATPPSRCSTPPTKPTPNTCKSRWTATGRSASLSAFSPPASSAPQTRPSTSCAPPASICIANCATSPSTSHSPESCPTTPDTPKRRAASPSPLAQPARPPEDARRSRLPGIAGAGFDPGLSGRSTTQTVRDNPRVIAPTGVNPFLRTVIEQVRAPVDSHRRV
jgi:hypothetical protein